MALPATIYNSNVADWAIMNGVRLGPFQVGSNLYALAFDTTNSRLLMYRSTDGGNTWAEVDAAHHPTNANGQMDAVLVGSTIHLVYTLVSTNALIVQTFANDLWGTASASGPACPGYSGGLTGCILQILVRSNGDRVIAYQSAQAAGQDRVSVVVYASGAWGGAQLVGSSSTNWNLQAACLGATDRVHMLYTKGTAFTTLYHRSLSNTNVLDTEAVALNAVMDSVQSVWNPVSTPVYNPAATEIVCAFHATASPFLRVVRFASQANPASFPITNVSTMTPDDSSSGSVGVCLLLGSVIHLIFLDATSSDLYRTSDGGNNTWVAPVVCEANITGSGLSAWMNSGTLAFMYGDTTGTPKVYRYDRVAFANTITATPSGGIQLGGQKTYQRILARTQTGGLQLGGSVARSRTLGRTPTAGLVLGGQAQTVVGGITYAYQWQRDNQGGGVWSNIAGATGNVYTTGVADVGCRIRCVVTATDLTGSRNATSNLVGPVTPQSINLAPSGGLVLGGSRVTARTLTRSSSGGVQLGGQVVVTRVVAPPAVYGGLVLGGQVTILRALVKAPAGGVRLGGSLVVSGSRSRLPVGGIVLGGTAATTKAFGYPRSGGLVLGGSCQTTKARAYSPAAGIRLGGSATSSRTLARPSSGGIVLGGQTAFTRTLVKTQTGGLVLGGQAQVSKSFAYPTAGGIRLGGQVVTGRTTNINIPADPIGNGKFETDLTGWSASSSYWNNAGATISRDTANAHSGAASMLLTTDGVTASQGVRTPIQVVAGVTYTFVAWLKGSGTVHLAAGDGTRTPATGGPTITLTAVWTRYTLQYTPTSSGSTYFVVAAPIGQTIAISVNVDDVTGAPAAGIVLGGTVQTILDIGSNKFPIGGIRLGGQVARAVGRSPTGGIRLGGQATASRAFGKAPSGGIILGGAAPMSRLLVKAATGGVRLGGQVRLGLARPVAGGIRLGGSCQASRVIACTRTGGLVLGGHVALTGTISSHPVGGIRLAGTVVISGTHTSTPVGGIRLAGSVVMQLVLYHRYTVDATFAVTATGNASLDVDATADADLETAVDQALILSVL